MTEVIITVDCRKELDSVKKRLDGIKEEICNDSNKQVAHMLECFRTETKGLLKQLQGIEDK